jgi:Tfp pilus assembly protein PilF
MWRLLTGLAFLALTALLSRPSPSLYAAEEAPAGAVTLLTTHGEVEVMRAGANTWDVASTNQQKNILRVGDQLRTRRNSRAAIQLADRTITMLRAESHFRILQPLPQEVSLLDVVKGWFYFLHRDRPGRVGIRSATITAAIEGTEFTLEVAEADGTTRLDLFEGQVAITNAAGGLVLRSGEAGVARPATAPERTAVLEAVNVVQWNLYYPAVLDIDELPLTADERNALRQSIQAYLTGDLLKALSDYPPNRTPASDAEKTYRAGLLLAVGDVAEAEILLDSLAMASPHARALRQLIAAVKFQPFTGVRSAQLSAAGFASEWLAESYYQQSRSNLEGARAAAQKAVAVSPQFAFALARLAELEFGFGRVASAEAALQQSLALAPHNAQAVALHGFLLAARNQTEHAIATFECAIALDSRLANAWLGRGLCRIRRGHVDDGLNDLLVAAATEPQRAVLRSYLGKAFTSEGELGLAQTELARARLLDPNDPTSWLYSALLNQLDNRINRAIDDLEQSQARNGNRSVYRSRELLDQDRAVRGVNLANAYDDAGLTDVAYREAVHAVHDDYANFSSHLFLANSFNRLRDPRQVNLRYETPWFSEYLVANLLAPVGAGTLSQLVSTEEYARLFERNGLGLVSLTEYLSNGDWLQAAAQHGRVGNWSYALGGYYQSQTGYRPNGDLEATTLSFQWKYQIGPKDDVFFDAIYYHAEGGDLVQHYSEAEVNRGLRFKETQEPILIGGYHHAWAPGSHTLLMAARLDDTFSVTNPEQPIFNIVVDPNTGQFLGARGWSDSLAYRNQLEIYATEGQHIQDYGNHRSILGARYQTGEFATRNFMPGFIPFPQTSEQFETDFTRVSAYAYQHWQPLPSLRLLAGLAYDRLSYPENFRHPPISDAQATAEEFSPKAGLLWSPLTNTTVRAAYTRSLGGVSLEQSLQLEPAQIAGFVQTYRSLIPESAKGAVAVPRNETFGLALDQKFPTRTYVGISGEWLESEATRQVGTFLIPPVPGLPSTTRETLDFRERTITFSANQLLGEEWALSAAYRVSWADLQDTFPALPTQNLVDLVRQENLRATLHQVQLSAVWNSPSGFFAGTSTVFSAQDNQGYSPARPGDAFWQFDIYGGYRFMRRRAELTLGVLNLTDQDYKLNPLNLTAELPRERTLALRLRLAL